MSRGVIRTDTRPGANLSYNYYYYYYCMSPRVLNFNTLPLYTLSAAYYFYIKNRPRQEKSLLNSRASLVDRK